MSPKRQKPVTTSLVVDLPLPEDLVEPPAAPQHDVKILRGLVLPEQVRPLGQFQIAHLGIVAGRDQLFEAVFFDLFLQKLHPRLLRHADPSS